MWLWIIGGVAVVWPTIILVSLVKEIELRAEDLRAVARAISDELTNLKRDHKDLREELSNERTRFVKIVDGIEDKSSSERIMVHKRIGKQEEILAALWAERQSGAGVSLTRPEGERAFK